MTSNGPLRRQVIGMAVVGCVAGAAALYAQTVAKFDTYTATTANLSVGAGEKLKINVLKWSSEEDRGKVIAAFKEKGDAQLNEAVQGNPSAGYIWTDETLGYTLRYAFRQTLPNGGERIVLLTDRRLGSWSGQPWKPANSAVDYPFTVIEMRLNKNGAGEGKMSLTTKLAVDEAAKTIGLEHYDSAPVLLKGVKREAGRQSN